MQGLQHAQTNGVAMTWRHSSIANDGTHHVHDGRAMYPHRFLRVQKFHEPGLAPVADASGAYHIAATGQAAYPGRFLQTWGFYEGRAAVQDDTGWFHILADGRSLSTDRFDWCGNFQGGRCAVRTVDKAYLHLTEKGVVAYAERYLYAGDFRDGAAVVRCPTSGLCTHIDPDGRQLHGRWFVDLDVFHKGFARARDEAGWFHVDQSGKSITSNRYAEVEPFYNGQARVFTHGGEYQVIDEAGQLHATVGRIPHDTFMQVSADLVGHWRTDTITAAATIGIFGPLPATAATLADSLGMPEASTSRLLGALWELGLVRPEASGIWACTERGKLLCGSRAPQLADAAAEFGGPLRERWSRLLEALRSTEWRPSDVFLEASQSPTRVDLVQRMLASYAEHDYRGLASRMPFAAAKKIVDVGGGTGVLAREIASAFPSASVSVLERPEVCALPACARHQDGIDFVSGDLFEKWSFCADAIVLARVLHDWNDTDAIRILLNARRSMVVGGTCVILELLLADDSPFGRLCDIHMLVVTGGRERTLHEFDHMLSKCGFKRLRCEATESVVSMIIAEAV